MHASPAPSPPEGERAGVRGGPVVPCAALEDFVALKRWLAWRDLCVANASEGAVEDLCDFYAAPHPSPLPLRGRGSRVAPNWEGREEVTAFERRLGRRNRFLGEASEGADEAPSDFYAAPHPSPLPLRGRGSRVAPNWEGREEVTAFERRLGRRNRFLGEASEGADEAPSDFYAAPHPSPLPLRGRGSRVAPNWEGREEVTAFERRLGRRNRFLGEASEGADEAPSEL